MTQEESKNLEKKALPLWCPQYIIEAIDAHKRVEQQPSRNNTAINLLEEILTIKGYLN